MIFPVAGLLAGLALGWILPVNVPVEYSKYMSVALMAGLDSVFGGMRSTFERKYDNAVFITGFFTNSLLAVGISYIGEKLSIDLYFVAILAFGLRIFQNLAICRRHILRK
ncbi:MAG: small basic family protein [Acidaminococcales bacterium]|jgi:small basic protein|nr:small basic family protein [Acidaminococcales bacterium]